MVAAHSTRDPETPLCKWFIGSFYHAMSLEGPALLRAESNVIHVGFEQYSETSGSSPKYTCQTGRRYGYLAGSLYDMDKPQSSEHVVAVHLSINTLVVRTFIAIDLYFFSLSIGLIVG